MSGPELAWAIVTIVAAAGLWARAEFQLRQARKIRDATYRDATAAATKMFGDLDALSAKLQSDGQVLLDGAKAINTETAQLLERVITEHRGSD